MDAHARSHTPTWTPPQDWLAHDDQLPPLRAPTPGNGHRRTQTAQTAQAAQAPVPSHRSFLPDELAARPPTTNVLAAAEKSQLRRTTRKLERVLGETPTLVYDGAADASPVLPSPSSSLRRRTTLDGGAGRTTPTPVSPAGHASLRPRPGLSMDLPRSLSPHPTLRIVPAADPLPPIAPSPLSASAPTPSDTLSPPPISSTSTRRSSVSSTSASSSTGLTPPASPTPTPMPAPRRQMAKLQRYLGENVPADLLLAPVSSHSSVSSSASTGTAFSIGGGSIAEAGTPPRSLRRAPSASSNGPGLASRAKRRLSLELSALASFNLSARLQAAGPPPPRAPSPNPRSKTVPAALTIVQSPTSTSSRSSMSTEPATPTLPALSRTGTDMSAATRRSIEKDLKLRPRTAGMRSVREETELDPMALVYSHGLPMPKIRPKTEKEKQKEREKEERKREKEEKKKSKKANSISVVAGASRTSFESKASLDVSSGGLRGLIRKKSFDAWSARKEHPLPPVPASMTMHARATSESIRPSTAPQPPPPTLVPAPMREKEIFLPIANLPVPTTITTTTRERDLPPVLAPMNFPSAPAPVFGKDDNDRLGAAALRRSGSQSRSSEERPQRARSRRRKSRSMTGLPIGKLALGGYALELDPDPTWDAAQSDYETSQRRRQGRALITADVVDHSDGDVEWMWRRGARPRRGRARALEDESDDDASDNDGSIARRREMAMAALAGVSKASSEGGHSNMPPRRPLRADWTDASSSSLGHANVSSPSVDMPAFTDPFSRAPLPPMPAMVPPERPSPLERSKSSPTVPPRSAMRPTAPTPVPPLPSNVPMPNNAPLPPIAPEQKGRFARFFRSGSASSGSAQGKVLRKDRERSVERKTSMSLKHQQQQQLQQQQLQQQQQQQQQPVRFVPAHPLPPPPPPPPQGFVKGHTPSVSFSGSANVSETQVEVVDSDGRKGYVPVDDVMFALRQLRAL